MFGSSKYLVGGPAKAESVFNIEPMVMMVTNLECILQNTGMVLDQIKIVEDSCLLRR